MTPPPLAAPQQRRTYDHRLREHVHRAGARALKTFLASALRHLCCRAGFNVRFQRADELLRILKQSRMDNSRNALMTQFATVDVLIIDDFALEPMTRDESRDVYQLLVDRNARFSTIVTSNRDTAEWIATFDDALLAQSAVDRFKNNAFDLVVDGESYRSRLKPPSKPWDLRLRLR